ncbi:MAG TPA: hypothetical protein VEP90_28140 [Methylomirabilota bacterium]|nr:hypothetical protein [Methylomirabilota bacterium]
MPKIFEVTLHDPENTRDWHDPDTREKTQHSTLQVAAATADAAKEFAIQQNPGLEATEAKEIK